MTGTLQLEDLVSRLSRHGTVPRLIRSAADQKRRRFETSKRGRDLRVMEKWGQPDPGQSPFGRNPRRPARIDFVTRTS